MLGFDAILQPGQDAKPTYMILPPNDPSPQPSRRKYLQGWRFGAINCGIAASVVFLVNLVATIVCTRHSRDEPLYKGDCERARQINTALHIFINILSTVLLSSSNYCMQCLSAPTRKDVDAAHALNKWLDIGIMSYRNLRFISKKRVALWALLALSSVPLHLMFNSVVYMSITDHEYSVFGVTQSFINSSGCEGCSEMYRPDSIRVEDGPSSEYENTVLLQNLHRQAYEGRLERLENLDCINAYARLIQSDRRNLFLVFRDDDAPIVRWITFSEASPVFWAHSMHFYDPVPYSWISPPPFKNTFNELQNSPANWTVESCDDYWCDDSSPSGPIQYCLSEKIEPQCQIRWSTEIAMVVVLLNFLKTTDMCLVSMDDAILIQKKSFKIRARRWNGQRHKWKDAVSGPRSGFLFLLVLAILTAISFLLHKSIQIYNDSDREKLANWTEIGFGAIDPRTMIDIGSPNVLANALVANSAQLAVSVFYFSYNSLFTNMVLGYEWATYAYQKKGLRVTTQAKGDQRSSYFLSLPYRFALPMMIASGLMHWVMSQSFFFVALDRYSAYNLVGYTKSFKCGFSPIAIITGLVVVVVLLLVAFVVGNLRHPHNTILVGSCSIAISAACHPLLSGEDEGRDLAQEKLQWGVVGENPDGSGHCSFSGGPVDELKKGGMY
ncbi:unnamed protein product [Periconia digitata]|uniref:DUF6536 domain-containing protein n=1 Tax=Periconia digitata TaxID=1303443 RepID=A0A9W4UAN1_9PLEO|nr:unnamed protein product [Periconia digitata]